MTAASSSAWRRASSTGRAAEFRLFLDSGDPIRHPVESTDPLPHPLVSRNANCAGANCPPGLSYQFLRVGGGGSVAWTGDYIAHVAKVPLLRNLPTATNPNPPAWRPSRPGDPSTVLAFWPDFSKVAFPIDAISGLPDINAVASVGSQTVSAWTQFVPAGFASCANPKTRDVRVLFAEITNRGLLVSVKATSRRPLVGATAIPPEFAVNVQNLTGETIFVRLTLTDSAPVEDWSLRQTRPDEPSPADLNQVDLKVMRNSSVTQMIYYRWRDSSQASPTAPALVSVQQLTGRLLDNSADCPIPDPQNPPPVVHRCASPAGRSSPNGLTASAMYNVTSSSLPIGTAHGVLVSTPVVTSFSSASDQPSNSRIDNSRIDNSRIDNSRIDNSRIDNSRIDNSRIDNSRIDNSRIDNSLVPDQQILWTVTGAGALTTATTAFSQVANGQALLENGWSFQLLIYQTQLNPNVDGLRADLDGDRRRPVQCGGHGTERDVLEDRQLADRQLPGVGLAHRQLAHRQLADRQLPDRQRRGRGLSPLGAGQQRDDRPGHLRGGDDRPARLQAPGFLVAAGAGLHCGRRLCPERPDRRVRLRPGCRSADRLAGGGVLRHHAAGGHRRRRGTQGSNDWYRSDVTVTWAVQDPQSGIVSTTGCDPVTLTDETDGVRLTCSATNGKGLSDSASVTIKIDKTPPTASASASPAANANGWNNTSVDGDLQWQRHSVGHRQLRSRPPR